MLLGIDVGNSNIVLGVFDGAELRASWRIQTRILATTEEYEVLVGGLLAAARLDPSTIDGVALASVVPPLTAAFADLAHRMFHRSPLVVDAGVKTGVKVRYDSPRDVGADRVVNAAAVCSHYGTPACIIDFGTGTTFDAINATGEYLGGAIAPGLEISLQALAGRTARLPNVELRPPPASIGRNTVHAMQSGLVFGYVALVEGMVERFRAELGPGMRVIGTGGLADVIAGETTVIERIDPWLTLKGLRIVYDLNRDHHERESQP
ncbi:MAG: type III pantothenate kinase [Spirochaetaceae bacterium]|nr:type III pantothenate kinase [Spirochaetaceae bacterium]